MNNYNIHREMQRSPAKTSLIGMIRTRKLAIKLKRRAQFLVAHKYRRENFGTTAIIHHDIPQQSYFHRNIFGINNERYNLTSGDGKTTASREGPSTRMHDRRIRQVGKFITRPENIFPVIKAELKISEILERRLKNTKYSSTFGKEISKSLSNEIKREVKTCYDLQRFKLICIVNLGEIKFSILGNAMFGSRCLWNTITDNFASSSYQNAELFAVATIYALYQE